MDFFIVGVKGIRRRKHFLAEGAGVEDPAWIPLVRMGVKVEAVTASKSLVANGTDLPP